MRDELVNPSRRLPELSLPSASDGSPTPLRPGGRRAAVLVLVHAAGCAECAAYVHALAAEREAIADWDGRPLLVAPEGDTAGEAFPTVVDAEGRVGAALGVRAPAVVVADQWGEIHEASEAGEAHRFPPVEEIVSTLRYLAIQCPECQGEAY